MQHLRHEHPELSDEQRRTLDALIANPTKVAAAQALGINRSTLYYRLSDPALSQAYNAVRQAAIRDASDSLQTIAAQAVHVLHFVANSDAPAHVRVSAARAILDMAFRAYEIQDVIPRIEALEREMDVA